MLRPLLITLLCGGLVAACTNDIDTSPNYLVLDANIVEEDEGVGPPPDAGATCGDCVMAGTWYRFTTLKVTQLDEAGPGQPEGPIGVLNPIWAGDIANFELNILFEVLELTSDMVRFRVVNGARVGSDGQICVLEDTGAEIVYKRTGCALNGEEPANLFVYAGTATNPKNCAPNLQFHAIPVSNVLATATFTGICDDPEADKISGSLTGVLGKDDLPQICACIVVGDQTSDDCMPPDPSFLDDGKDPPNCAGCSGSFNNLFGLLIALNKGNDLNYTCQTTDGKEATCIEADFVATRMTESPGACQ